MKKCIDCEKKATHKIERGMKRIKFLVCEYHAGIYEKYNILFKDNFDKITPLVKNEK